MLGQGYYFHIIIDMMQFKMFDSGISSIVAPYFMVLKYIMLAPYHDVPVAHIIFERV